MKTRNYRISVGPALDLDIGETGAVDGRPVILIHGLSDSWSSYLPLMAEMPDDMRLIAVSLRGHGNSAKPAQGYRLADMARDVLAVMDALGLARADVVGHSLGSTVAQKLVELVPGRVASLTLIGAFIRMGTDPAVISFRDDAIVPLTDPVDPGFVREFQEGAVGPDTPRKIIERAVAESMKLTASDWKAAMDAAVAADLTHALDGFTGPVLVLHGQLDGFCLAAEQAELALGEGRRLISQAHWGHSPHWEHPAETASMLARLIGEEAATQPAA
ncbi:alpha/beta fold hydrolase [Bradyrhizobium sp.]|uniref:alpha/beta fold hydrolase n=1 Tax=Bradyrhizobium sp. TaxID=376 RepID=UPI0027345762|nr:alpha/beta hydrolase [Bradyrhizobium sp.]MDP3689608.1 alpha/beta hydrolase [Bradyrhizobium sp.]